MSLTLLFLFGMGVALGANQDEEESKVPRAKVGVPQGYREWRKSVWNHGLDYYCWENRLKMTDAETRIHRQFYVANNMETCRRTRWRKSRVEKFEWFEWTFIKNFAPVKEYRVLGDFTPAYDPEADGGQNWIPPLESSKVDEDERARLRNKQLVVEIADIPGELETEFEGANGTFARENLAIMPQPGKTSCTGAVSAMLIFSATGSLPQQNIVDLTERGIADWADTCERDLEKANLPAKFTRIDSLRDLGRELVRNGPAIIPIPAHVVVADAVVRNRRPGGSEYDVWVRDPYHAWLILLDGRLFWDAFTQGNEDQRILQVGTAWAAPAEDRPRGDRPRPQEPIERPVRSAAGENG